MIKLNIQSRLLLCLSNGRLTRRFIRIHMPTHRQPHLMLMMPMQKRLILADNEGGNRKMAIHAQIIDDPALIR